MKTIRALVLASMLALAISGSAAARTSPDFFGHNRQVFDVYVVKGLSVGRIMIYPPMRSSYVAEDNIINQRVAAGRA